MTVLNRKQVIERLKAGEKLHESGNTMVFPDDKSCSGWTHIWLLENNIVKVSGGVGHRILSWDFLKTTTIKKSTITDSEKRELAERHWNYTKGILKALGKTPTELEHYLYIESFIHGMKHGEVRTK